MMIKILSLINGHAAAGLVTLIFLSAGTSAPASESPGLPLVPLPSVLDFTRGGGWGVALGAGLEYGAAYDGSDEYELEFEPAGAIQWRTGNHLFSWEGLELAWKGRFARVWLAQAGARYESGLEPDDSDDGCLDGIAERDSHIAGFVEIRRALGQNWRNWLAARVLGGESDFGWLGILAAGRRFGSKMDGTGAEIFLFSTFADAAFINKDFGVSRSDSETSGLARTDLGGGYRSTGITGIFRQYLTRHVHVIAEVGAELYSSEIQDSPIARDDFEAEIGVSLLWHF
ncbi:MAG: MipA/OmpV family protein [Desulfobacterales bacterium]